MHDEEGGLGLELGRGVDELEVEVAQQPRADLVDLQQSQVAADADVGSTTELCVVIPCK